MGKNKNKKRVKNIGGTNDEQEQIALEEKGTNEHTLAEGQNPPKNLGKVEEEVPEGLIQVNETLSVVYLDGEIKVNGKKKKWKETNKVLNNNLEAIENAKMLIREASDAVADALKEFDNELDKEIAFAIISQPPEEENNDIENTESKE